jgi:hypothetical protein
MDTGWLTYSEAAERLGSTAEAVMYRAIRGKWPRMRGNDGRARVQVPDERPSAAHPVRTLSTRAGEIQLIKALEAHVETLKEQLTAAEARLPPLMSRGRRKSPPFRLWRIGSTC